MYQYGIPIATLKKLFPTATSFGSHISVGEGSLHNFPGDCGALLLSGCNYITKTELETLMQIASTTGHSKIFGTIVKESASDAQAQKRMFVEAGWTVIHEGVSNRSDYKTDIVLFYHNPNCIKKGY